MHIKTQKLLSAVYLPPTLSYLQKSNNGEIQTLIKTWGSSEKWETIPES